jgi:hypothetical protein
MKWEKLRCLTTFRLLSWGKIREFHTHVERGVFLTLEHRSRFWAFWHNFAILTRKKSPILYGSYIDRSGFWSENGGQEIFAQVEIKNITSHTSTH